MLAIAKHGSHNQKTHGRGGGGYAEKPERDYLGPSAAGATLAGSFPDAEQAAGRAPGKDGTPSEVKAKTYLDSLDASGGVDERRDLTVRTVASLTGMPPDVVDSFGASWEGASNGDWRAAELNAAAERIFPTSRMSGYQEKVNEGLLQERMAAHTSRLRNRTKVQDRLMSVTERGNGDPDPRVQRAMAARGYDGPEDATEHMLAGMYRMTQANLQEAGIEEVTVYRGITLKRSEAERLGITKGTKPGTVIKGTGNALESWSSSPSVAKSFGQQAGKDTVGVTVRTTFPRQRVVGTGADSLGTMVEREWVISSGNVVDDFEIVAISGL